MKRFLKYIYDSCNGFGIQFRPYESVIKQIDDFEEKIFSNIEINIDDGKILDVKIYFSSGSNDDCFYSEKSMFIINNNNNFSFRDVKKHFSKTKFDGMNAIRESINDKTSGLTNKYIEIGNAIQRHTNTKIYPFFGGGRAYKSSKIWRYKLYYTFFSYDKVGVAFGETDAKKAQLYY